MATLAFLFAVFFIFGSILAMEANERGSDEPHRPLGLIAWLTSGNWPAKVGGGLLVVGIGALLRYVLANLDVPPGVKLGSGVAIAGALGLAATLTRIGHARRAVSLALGGAAFGVAYLTAYSAFALFHYMDSSVGLILLTLTSVGAGVYAVTRGALSIALLAMVGAYLSPAFAIADPGPAVVYGYLAAASALTLVMVSLRGWRPLIHLSFLFTLGGGVFFAWTAKYFTPEHAGVMLPAVLLLAGLHALMPIAERSSDRGVWVERFDLAFLLILPSAAGLSALAIAPSSVELSNELMGLAVIWAVLATYLAAARRDGAVVHAVIGLLLLGFGTAARFRELPGELIALTFSVLALWLATRRSQSERLKSALAGLVPLLGAVHIMNSLLSGLGDPAHSTGRFVERIIGAGLLMFAGHLCRSIRNNLDTLLWSVGLAWGVIAVGSELLKWELVTLSMLAHLGSVALAILLAVRTPNGRAWPDALHFVAIGVLVTSAWASVHAPAAMAWVLLVVSPLSLLAMGIRRAGIEPAPRLGRLMSMAIAPFVAWIWANHGGTLIGIGAPQFAICVAIATGLLGLSLGRRAIERCRDWLKSAEELCAFVLAWILVGSTVLLIHRSGWSIAMELLCLFGLGQLVLNERKEAPLPRWVLPGSALAVFLVLQANLLRAFGPPGDLNFLDISRMRLTALVSLLWAILGAGLTVWSRARPSRTLWMTGAALMAVAAVKLVLFDFGSLGQLGNILAVIAAGIVFLLVGWLAPMPPSEPHPPAAAPGDSEPPRDPPRAQGAVPAGSAGSAPAAARPMPSHADPGAASVKGQGGEAPNSTVSPMSDYWDRNASQPRPDYSRTSEDSGSRFVWVVVILVALMLSMSQCAHVAKDQLVRTLSAGTASSGSSTNMAPARPQISVRSPSGTARAPVGAAQAADSSDCAQWARQLPPEYVVYAAGDIQGSMNRADAALEVPQRGRFWVSVSEPGRPIVLLLGSHQAAAWYIHWTPATQIAGIWVSGSGPQAILGVSTNIPVLRTVSSGDNACPWFEVPSRAGHAASVAALEVLDHEVARTYIANNGQIVIGKEINPATETESVRMLSPVGGEVRATPLENPSISTLVRGGVLRPATIHDLAMWKSSLGAEQLSHVNVKGGTDILTGIYVAKGPFTMPGGLAGQNAVTILVPPGVSRPGGNPGESKILSVSP